MNYLKKMAIQVSAYVIFMVALGVIVKNMVVLFMFGYNFF